MREEDFCEYCRNILYHSPKGFVCRNLYCFANIFVVENFVKSYRHSEKGIGKIEEILENDRFLVSFENGESFEVKKSDLTHYRFEKGDKVDTDYGVGMVSSWNYTKSSNYLFYEVFLPEGIKTIKETSIRNIARTNPIELIKERKFDNLTDFYLRNRAVFFKVAQQSDEFICIHNSRIDLLKHQIFAAHKVISEYNPRFILADEVGLGKTIEAGLVMKELKSRGLAERVLIITPANLVSQWRTEMETKFNERFEIYNRHKEEELRSSNPSENVWSLNNNVICSLQFARKRTDDIAKEFWDLIIFDEAHHLRRRLVSGEPKPTKSYKSAEALKERCNSMLLLTATPLQLETFEFYSTLELLDPTIFESYIGFERYRKEVLPLISNLDNWLANFEELNIFQKNRIRSNIAELIRILKKISSSIESKISSDKDLFELLRCDEGARRVLNYAIRKKKGEAIKDLDDFPQNTLIMLDKYRLFDYIDGRPIIRDDVDLERIEAMLIKAQKSIDRKKEQDLLSLNGVDFFSQFNIGTMNCYLETPEGRDKLRQKLKECNLINQIMIRNRRRDIHREYQIIRKATTIKITFTPEEEEIYNEVSNYVKTEYNRAIQENNNALGFVMVIFQKLLTSSRAALVNSFRNRIDKLKKEIKRSIKFDPNEFEEETDDVQEQMMDELLSLSIHAEEIEILEDLCKKLEAIKKDIKAEKLLSAIDEILEENPDEKILIYTQFLGTQDYLNALLTKKGYSVVKFNGKPECNKDDAVNEFKKAAQIMISTECGGEGRNLQFCHIMFNYDLPWNPMKVEQRIGRLDRLKQKKNVLIYNFALEGTIEQRIMDVLTKRIKIFEETIGGLEPILGDIETEIKSLVMSQRADLETEVERFEKKLEDKIKDAEAVHQKLEDFIMDKKAFQWEIDQLLSKKPTISPDDLRNFVELAILSLKPKADYVKDDKIYELKFKSPTNFGFPKVYRGTFDLELAKEDESLDFFAFGHEAIDNLIDQFSGPLTKPSAGIINLEGHEQANGVLFVYLAEFKGLTTKKKLIPIFVNRTYEFLEDLSNEFLKSDLKMWQKADHSDFEDFINDIDNLKNKSDEILMWQLEDEYRKKQEKNAKMVEKELYRSEKLFKLKWNKLDDQIRKEKEQLSRIRYSGDEKQKRIIPALEGKIRRLQNRIDNLEIEKEDKLKRLNEQKKVEYNYQLISAALVS